MLCTRLECPLTLEVWCLFGGEGVLKDRLAGPARGLNGTLCTVVDVTPLGLQQARGVWMVLDLDERSASGNRVRLVLTPAGCGGLGTHGPVAFVFTLLQYYCNSNHTDISFIVSRMPGDLCWRGRLGASGPTSPEQPLRKLKPFLLQYTRFL